MGFSTSSSSLSFCPALQDLLLQLPIALFVLGISSVGELFDAQQEVIDVLGTLLGFLGRHCWKREFCMIRYSICLQNDQTHNLARAQDQSQLIRQRGGVSYEGGRRAEFHEGGTNLHGTELGPGLEPFASVIEKVSFHSITP